MPSQFYKTSTITFLVWITPFAVVNGCSFYFVQILFTPHYFNQSTFNLSWLFFKLKMGRFVGFENEW